MSKSIDTCTLIYFYPVKGMKYIRVKNIVPTLVHHKAKSNLCALMCSMSPFQLKGFPAGRFCSGRAPSWSALAFELIAVAPEIRHKFLDKDVNVSI